MSERWFDVARDQARFRVHVAGEGPPLLILHGLGDFGERVRQEAPEGFRVASFDQRGHGSTVPLTESSAYDFSEFTRDALAVLDALDTQDEANWQRVIVEGSSMGASVALRLALVVPERIEHLLLTGIAFGDRQSTVAEAFASMATSLETAGSIRDWLAERDASGQGSSEASRARLQAWQHHDLAALCTLLRTVGAAQPVEDLARLGQTGVSTSIVAWPDDPIHPLELAERIAATMAARLRIFSDSTLPLEQPSLIGRAHLQAIAHLS